MSLINNPYVVNSAYISTRNYKEARTMLAQLCERYVAHNESQLNALPKIDHSLIHGNFDFNRNYSRCGFSGWIAYKYRELYSYIVNLRSDSLHAPQHSFISDGFFPEENAEINPNYFNGRGYVAPFLVINKLNALYNLMHHVMVDVNKEPSFKQKLEEYHAKNKIHYAYSESDPLSVHAYKTLMRLNALISFVDTYPKYHAKEKPSLKHYFNELLPTFEGYIKGIAVQEIQAILNDKQRDAAAVKMVASRLENPITLEILAKNRQSQTEYFLKVLSVVLISVGIGVLPTLFLAAKRLYDTDGASANFFKPLSKNLHDETCFITSNVRPEL